MSFTAQEWTDDYTKAKAFCVQLGSSSSSRYVRAPAGLPIPTPTSPHPSKHNHNNRQQLANLEQSIDRLDYRLGMMEQNPGQFGV